MSVTIRPYGRILQYNSRIFLTGGGAEENRYGSFGSLAPTFSQTNEFIESTKALKALSDMIYGRKNHCMLSIDDSTFCVIGGEQKNIKTNTCEKYSIPLNKWSSMPSLNFELGYISGIRIANKAIYVFGDNYSHSSEIQYLDLSHSEQWKSMRISGYFNLSVTNPFLIELPTKEILIFSSSSLYILSISEKDSCSIRNDCSFKPSSDRHFQSSLIGDTIYSIGFSGTVHTYKPYKRIYRKIEKKK